jgi:hypothetical protein
MKARLYIIYWSILIIILAVSLSSFGQLSANTVGYEVTYEISSGTYSVWVVPNYNSINSNNPSASEFGATAQVSFKVPTGFIISNITDVKGTWYKTPQKLGPAEQTQLSGQGLPAGTSYYVIGKSASETNYGAFSSGVPVKLFTFTGNGCFGAIEVLTKNDPFVTVVESELSLNTAPSFYSRSGQPSDGGNQSPLEQFDVPFGSPANCLLAFDDDYTAQAATPSDQAVLANDQFNGVTPATSDSVRVTIDTDPSSGSVTVNLDGTITYTANAGFAGTDTYKYTICDLQNLTVCSTATVTVTVTCPEPTDPTFVVTQPTCTVATGTLTISTPAMGTDISYTITGPSPAVTAVNKTSNTFEELAPGDYSVTTTNAGGCTSASVSFTVNDPSTITPAAPTASVTAQPTCSVATGTITVAAPANGSGTTYTVTGTNPVVTAVSNSTGVFSGLTSGNYEVTTTNASGCTSLATNLDVNPQSVTPTAPTVTSPVTYCRNVTAAALTATAPAGATLQWYTVPTNGLGSSTAPVPPTTTLGSTTYYVSSVSTSAGACESARVPLVVEVLDCRVIYAFNDNNLTPINTPVSGQVLTNDDINNGTVGLVVTTVPVQGPTSGLVVLNSSGTYTYTPNPTFVGVDSFVYRVCDQGSPEVCDTATVYIKVVQEYDPVNNNPPIALGEIYSTTLGTAVTGNVLLNDNDPDGQPLTATPRTQPVNGSLVFNPDGSFTYTPGLGFTGSDTFTYTACDTGNPAKCDSATVQIVVKDNPIPGQNMPPIAVDDLNITPSNTPVSGNVSNNDNDSEPDPTSLTVKLTPILLPSNGIITLASNGDYTYTPTNGFAGIDRVVYEICDAGTPIECARATLLIYVLEGKVSLLARAHLQGALFGVDPPGILMRDDLRVKNLIPLESPYSGPGFTAVTTTADITPAVLAVTGNNAIVDWVFVELRSSEGNQNQQAEDSRSALIQRDGDIVDIDGISPITFSQASPGSYYVMIKHRNHLSTVTRLPITLSPTPVIVDFTTPATPTFTDNFPVSTQARVVVSQGVAMKAGNARHDDKVFYQGTENEIEVIYSLIRNDPANQLFKSVLFILKSYNNGDINMNGETIFTGNGNDLEFIY